MARDPGGTPTAKTPRSTARTTKKSVPAQSSVRAKKSVPARKKTGSPASSRDVLAAGIARASGERARRSRTPLLAVAPPDSAAPPARPVPAADQVPVASTRKHRPQPSPKAAAPSAKAVAHSGGRQRRSEPGKPASRTSARAVRPLASVPDVLTHPTSAEPATPEPDLLHPGVEDLVHAGVAALRTVAASAGISPEEVEVQVARTLAFLRRRLTGEFHVDEFGFDEDFTTNAYLPLLRPLYRRWFRVEVRGMENIPTEGGALIVANHSGTVAMDSLMTQVAVFDEHPAHRHLRMLGADLVFQTPVVGQVARKSGSTLAGNADAERLLAAGDLVGVWPEGFKGVGKPFRERYKLQRFGRGGFVSAAIRTGVPIIPCSIVGAEEIYPILGNMKTLARLVGAPYAPVTPTWPLLGPLGLIPLPSKWIIEFGVPVETQDLGAGAADDPMLVFDLTDQIRETIQQTLYSLLMQRRSVFF